MLPTNFSMRALGLGLLLITGVSGCGNILAPNSLGGNPLEASAQPTPTFYQCPFLFSFEQGAPDLNHWNFLSWANAITTLPTISNSIGNCGTRSMKVPVTMFNNNQGILSYAFAQAQNMNGRTATINIYFDPANVPPSNIQFGLLFVDRLTNWQFGTPNQVGSLAAGWNQLTFTFGPGAAEVNQMYLRFTMTASGPSVWVGNAWIDDINW